MSSFRTSLGLQEAAKRFSRGLLKAPAVVENRLGGERLFRTLEGLMPIQIQVHNDPSNRIALCCTRRAGKTFLAAPWLVELGMTAKDPETTNFFIAPTLEHAKGLIMRRLHIIKQETGLNYKIRNEPASVEFPNGAILYLRGAKDIDDLGVLAGFKCKMVWVEECQDIRDEVLRHIETKVGPALRDMQGKIVFSGTPGPVATGYWYAIASGKTPHWTNYHWSLFDNTHLPEDAKNLELICRDEGLTPEMPRFKRDYEGLWVEDTAMLCYQYDKQRNGVWEYGQALPEGHEWSHVIAVDFGYRPDPSAVVVLAYSHTCPTVFLMGEFKENDLSYTDLYNRGVLPFWRTYGPCVVVGDAASPQAIAEINQRWGIGMEPCTKANRKTSKASFMEIINSDFLTGQIQIPPESALARELSELVWDPRKLPERKEHPGRANHLCDANLYAYLRAKNWHQEEREQLAPMFHSADARQGWEMSQFAMRQAHKQAEQLDWSRDEDFRET